MAAGRGDVRRAERIFGALQRLRPRRSFAYIGQAVAYMNAGRHGDAAMLLERAARDVDAEELGDLNAFLGLALQLAGHGSASVRALRAAGSAPLAQLMLGG